MKESSFINVDNLDDHIPVTASTGSRNNVFVEWERNEHNDRQEVDCCANSSHALRNVAFVCLA